MTLARIKILLLSFRAIEIAISVMSMYCIVSVVLIMSDAVLVIKKLSGVPVGS